MSQSFEPLFDLSKDIAVVLGATGLLGGTIAEGLAQAGARVALLGRNQERGEARAKRIYGAGGNAAFYEADVMDRESLSRAHEWIKKKFGPPTVLVNATGENSSKIMMHAEQGFSKVRPEDWQTHFETNLMGGVLRPCQEFGPAMVERKRGSIINIASVATQIPISHDIAFSTAKAAVIKLTRSLAREWGPSGVRVNAISPGFFPNEENRRILFNENGSPTRRAQEILDQTALGRFGGSQELIGAALFLACSKASSFVTGTDLRVDGGFFPQTI